MVLRGIVVRFGGSLDDGMEFEGLGDFDEGNVEHFGGHASRISIG